MIICVLFCFKGAFLRGDTNSIKVHGHPVWVQQATSLGFINHWQLRISKIFYIPAYHLLPSWLIRYEFQYYHATGWENRKSVRTFSLCVKSENEIFGSNSLLIRWSKLEHYYKIIFNYINQLNNYLQYLPKYVN